MARTTMRHPAASKPDHFLRRDNHAERARRSDQILVTRVGLKIPSSIPYDDWENAGRRLSAVADSSAWCLGDWVVFGQHKYTDRYRRAVQAAGLDYQTIRNYAWVARSFDISRRRPGLSFQHHAEVAALSEPEQDYWLDKAIANGWSRNQLRQQVRGSRNDADSTTGAPALPQISVHSEQITRWRAAARSSGCSFESWIIMQLDQAASNVLSQPLPA